MNGAPLEKCKKYKKLVVVLYGNLSWHEHTDYIVNKASPSLGIIRQKLVSASTETCVQAFKSFVRSQLEYVGVTWASYQDYPNN